VLAIKNFLDTERIQSGVLGIKRFTEMLQQILKGGDKQRWQSGHIIQGEAADPNNQSKFYKNENADVHAISRRAFAGGLTRLRMFAIVCVACRERNLSDIRYPPFSMSPFL
jgi:hypothetical protein